MAVRVDEQAPSNFMAPGKPSARVAPKFSSTMGLPALEASRACLYAENVYVATVHTHTAQGTHSSMHNSGDAAKAEVTTSHKSRTVRVVPIAKSPPAVPLMLKACFATWQPHEKKKYST